MRIVGYLPKQPKWKCHTVDGVFHTGWCEVHNPYNFHMKNKKIEESEIPILEGKLTLESYGRGRSSAVFYWVDDNGNKYESAMKHSLAMFQKSCRGILKAQYTLSKQGTQISICLYEVKNESV